MEGQKKKYTSHTCCARKGTLKIKKGTTKAFSKKGHFLKGGAHDSKKGRALKTRGKGKKRI